MASSKAIDAVSRAVVALLRDHYRPDDFQNQPLEFRVCLAQDLPMEVGVSLFLYRIGANEAIHTLPERPLPDGPCHPHPLAVDLHFLLTAWAGDASLQHANHAYQISLPYVARNVQIESTDLSRPD